MSELWVQIAYLVAAVLFIITLKALTNPESARRGVLLGELGMLIAVVGTLMQHEVISFQWIVVGLAVGSLIGVLMAIRTPMTAMPQLIAISHAFGALAAVLVGWDKYLRHFQEISHGTMTAVGFEVLFGSLTVTGSLMAFGKLQSLLPDAALTYRGQNAMNLLLFAATIGMFGYLIWEPTAMNVFSIMTAAGALVGVLMVIPIGGADMPVVISLLNSYAGLAAAATGFALDNNVLIIVGALDGASGFLLSVIMSKAMNRSFGNVLFGAFGAAAQAGGPAAVADGQPVRATTAEDVAVQLAYAKRVVVVPGYGMAVAQAQQAVRELSEQIIRRGGEVLFAIHPVAGRMPGHMNVLLAEANVPYDQLVDMEEINDQFKGTDVVLVVGANDVVNPAARDDPKSPIYGMPILNVDDASSIIILKRGMAHGFAGIDNRLFYNPKAAMLFGDARKSISALNAEMKQLAAA